MTHTLPPKVLDKGFIRKIENGILIVSLRWGPLDVPVHAVRMNYNERRFDPQIGETLVFTANLNEDSKYIISSTVRPCDLLSVQAQLTFLSETSKFGHMMVNDKHIKVFVPFSARCGDVPWHGIGARVGKDYRIKVFRQEESHGCKYIAFSVAEVHRSNTSPQSSAAVPVCTMRRLGMPTTVQRQSDHQSVELVRNQAGVIYEISDDRVVSVLSPTCQLAFFPASLYESWMKRGRFVKFDARRISDNKLSKFLGSNPEDMGALYPYNNFQTLLLIIPAVLNKVSFGRCAYAWNDHIGRIYVPWTSMDKAMTSARPIAFNSVKLEIVYNGKNEDTPWVAIDASLYPDSEAETVLTENAQLLKTEDGWKVQTVIDSQDNPSIFLVKQDEKKKSTAFAKIADWNSGDVPAAGTQLRVTYYAQERHGRHALRAVLATPLDRNQMPIRSHRIHVGSNVKQLPELYEQPSPKNERVVVEAAPPPPPKNCWNLAALGAPKATTSSFLTSQDFPPVSEVAEQPETVPPAPSIREMEDAPPEYLTQSNGPRTGSVWSGTPVEAKPEPVSFFNAAAVPYSPFAAPQNGSSSFFSGVYSSFNDLSNVVNVNCNVMPSTINELINTQSESSSPGLKLDSEQTEPNCWSSFEPTTSELPNVFQFGFPTMDMPIFQRLLPGNETSLAQQPTNTLDAETVLKDLWKNPRFIASFSQSDPEMYELVRRKLNSP